MGIRLNSQLKLDKFLRKTYNKFSGKIPSGFSKTFAKGVTRFIKKEVHLSIAEKTQPQELVRNLNELLIAFEKPIDDSIAEVRKKV